MERTHLNSFLLLILISIALSCGPRKNIQTSDFYKIENIDSLNSYYLVYIKHDQKIYKVISKKVKSTCNIIKIKNTYPMFILEPLIKEGDYISQDRPANYLDFIPDKIQLDDSTIVIRDKGMDNIYKTNNLNGLCYKDLIPRIK
ncbi:hypothetical protein CHRYSEOSP005_10250 [Chryseobacterium sp. Alg-005]|uniref:hypothetical protein n=1 Tax=Chryseobacterium sp. Alg-005 TaxID=3159516 RepID=UPI0035558E97